MAPARRRRGAGFTLIEMAVALAVGAVCFALAAGLLIESHRLAAQAGLEIRTPEAAGPLDLLRNELQSASGIGGRVAASAGVTGSRDRLVLVRHGLPPVIYERDGDRLVRRIGEGGKGRTVVPDLVSWRWFPLGPNLVTVEVTYDPGWGAPGGVMKPRGPLAAPRAWRTTRFTAAIRGAGASRGW